MSFLGGGRLLVSARHVQCDMSVDFILCLLPEMTSSDGGKSSALVSAHCFLPRKPQLAVDSPMRTVSSGLRVAWWFLEEVIDLTAKPQEQVTCGAGSYLGGPGDRS